jgi:hypothetical protein
MINLGNPRRIRLGKWEFELSFPHLAMKKWSVMFEGSTGVILSWEEGYFTIGARIVGLGISIYRNAV